MFESVFAQNTAIKTGLTQFPLCSNCDDNNKLWWSPARGGGPRQPEEEAPKKPDYKTVVLTNEEKSAKKCRSASQKARKTEKAIA